MPYISDDTRRDILALLYTLAAQAADPESPCHKGLTAMDRCSKCGPILKARALVKELEHEPQMPAVDLTQSANGWYGW